MNSASWLPFLRMTIGRKNSESKAKISTPHTALPTQWPNASRVTKSKETKRKRMTAMANVP